MTQKKSCDSAHTVCCSTKLRENFNFEETHQKLFNEKDFQFVPQFQGEKVKKVEPEMISLKHLEDKFLESFYGTETPC